MTGSDAASENEMKRFEEKRDELLDGLLEAYEAGYKQAVEDCGRLDELPEKEVVEGSEYIGQCNYYYWDGRTLPLESWLREQFEIDVQVGDPDE